ncbi:hypothetical protein [Oceanobacillus limi]|nr:hypothetical protein [Oceanobacillus limi]
MKSTVYIYLLLLLLIVSSCSSDDVYEEFTEMRETAMEPPSNIEEIMEYPKGMLAGKDYAQD